MNKELAIYIDYVLGPRDKGGVVPPVGETHCKILKKILSTPELGYGLQVSDLNVEQYLPNIKETCDVSNFAHVEGYSKSKDNVRAWIPVLGMFVVASIYTLLDSSTLEEVERVKVLANL